MAYYICKHRCGNLFATISESKAPMFCCGEPMEELRVNTQEGVATEKHIPVVSIEEKTLKAVVGEVIHPMIDAHYIMWIALKTEKGLYIKHLKPGEKPEAEFALEEGEKPLECVAYCNLHGLWGVKLG